jgi:hypothetical protein
MNKLFITSAAVVALFAAPVFALEVENKDGKEHSVYVGTASGIDTVNIGAGATRKGICSVICAVSVAGDGQEYAVFSGDKAVIKDGKLQIMRKN